MLVRTTGFNVGLNLDSTNMQGQPVNLQSEFSVIMLGKVKTETQTEKELVQFRCGPKLHAELTNDVANLIEAKTYVPESDDGLIKSVLTEMSKKTDEWRKMPASIRTIFDAEVAAESNLLRFQIRVICESLSVLNAPVIITYTGADDPNLQWSDKLIDKFEISQVNATSRRVITGFGPSGCGKSTASYAIFKCMKLNAVSFVDISSPYQKIATIGAAEQCGFSDLESIFKKHAIHKQSIETFMDKCTGGSIVSLYYPETLSAVRCTSFGCMDLGSLSSATSKYKKLDPNWVAMLIYQHCSLPKGTCTQGNTCPYKDVYTCKGCDRAGTERSKSEGKMYSDDQYFNSMTAGYTILKQHTGSTIVIHNGGEAIKKSILSYACTPPDMNLPNALHKLPTSNWTVMNVDPRLHQNYNAFDSKVLEIINILLAQFIRNGGTRLLKERHLKNATRKKERKAISTRKR